MCVQAHMTVSIYVYVRVGACAIVLACMNYSVRFVGVLVSKDPWSVFFSLT